VSTDHFASIPEDWKIKLEKDGIEPEASPSPDYRLFIYRRNIHV
jgi:hypothetical protein